MLEYLKEYKMSYSTDLMKFDNLTVNLEILAEEASEIIQAKSKIIRFGLDDYHPKNGLPNRQKLEEEIGHFLAVVDILVQQRIITDKGIRKGKVGKLKKMFEWYFGEESLCSH